MVSLETIADYLKVDKDDPTLAICERAAEAYISAKTGWDYANYTDWGEALMLLCMVTSDFYEKRYYMEKTDEYRPSPVACSMITHLIAEVPSQEASIQRIPFEVVPAIAEEDDWC